MEQTVRETIGDYRVFDKLGEGKAGEVFLATPLAKKSFAEPGDLVAVKLYRPEILGKASQFQRIETEFKVGSQLPCENIARIYEYHSADSSSSDTYLVMEFIDGVSLDKWIQQFWPISPRLLMRMCDQLFGAVACMHEQQVLHRDIKPSNIIVSPEFELKLTDFGVVHIKRDTPLTDPDDFVGTIRNSSPEMLLGNEYDYRTDLYSAGTVLYALLHGRELFAGERQFVRLAKLVETAEPEFDQSRSLQEHPIVNKIIDLTRHLLCKHPDERPRSAKDVVERLQSLREHTSESDFLEPLPAYIATALTGLEPDVSEAIVFVSSKIAEVAKEYDIYVYQPRKATHPIYHTEVDPSKVYDLDRKHVRGADLLVVLANRPSLGVGQEIQIATDHSIPTLVVIRKETSLTRMVTGSPANFLKTIIYETPEDLARQLRNFFAENLGRIRKWRQLARVEGKISVGGHLAGLRQKCGYESPGELAESLGLSEKLVQDLERGEYDTVSLSLLSVLVAKLGSSLVDLIKGDLRLVEVAPSAPDVSLMRLERLAAQNHWTTGFYLRLRDDYLKEREEKELAADRASINVDDKEWCRRYRILEDQQLTLGLK